MSNDDQDDGYTPVSLGRGGLRRGHTGASDAGSRRLDGNLKSIRDELAEGWRATGVVMEKKIPKVDTITPCEPDGGAWFYDSILIAAFEAKKQQNAGNAIERWYKNNYRCNKLNPKVSYVTFCRGEGAKPLGVMGVALDVAHESWNEYWPASNSCWFEPQGFTKGFLTLTMAAVLLERLSDAGVGFDQMKQQGIDVDGLRSHLDKLRTSQSSTK